MTVSHNVPAIVREIQARIESRLPDNPVMRRKMLRIGALLQMESQRAYARSGLKRQTGTLVNSMVPRYETRGDVSIVRFGPWGVKYARIHEYGGIILPKNPGGYLVYQLPGGQWRKSRQVIIPARPYLRPTLWRAQRKISEILAEGGS